MCVHTRRARKEQAQSCPQQSRHRLHLHNLTTSQGPASWHHDIGELGFQHLNLGGHKHSVHSTQWSRIGRFQWVEHREDCSHIPVAVPSGTGYCSRKTGYGSWSHSPELQGRYCGGCTRDAGIPFTLVWTTCAYLYFWRLPYRTS